ncbi:MAG: TonB family protein [Lacunisphaera sp.]|nr:TonB family protein [Lacunisphaera sp.]
MNATFTGSYCDGETLQSRPVDLRVESGRLYLGGIEPTVDVSLADVRTSDRLGAVPCFLYLPDRQIVETHDHAAVAALVDRQRGSGLPRLIHWLEERSRVAAAATVLLVGVVTAIVYWGLPVLAERAAYAVPERIEAQAGQSALAAFARYLQPSQLGPADRLRVVLLLERVVNPQHLPRKVRVEFRSLGGKFPNAFALPGGIIVMSDELVKLTENDEELMAVLAHELGHAELRHGLQSVLRGSAALLVVSTVTGDLSTLTSFAATIPLTLLQRGYSREFEQAADDYALNVLHAAKVDPGYFASILEKLEKSRPDGAQDFSYLSTHPSTADRIRRINPGGLLPRSRPRRTGWVVVVPETTRYTTAELPLDHRKDTVANIVQEATPPRPLAQPPPDYPPELVAREIVGEVSVEFGVDAQGAVQAPITAKSQQPELEAPVLAAVAQWKFSPSQFRGRNIPARVTATVKFGLDESAAPAKPAFAAQAMKPGSLDVAVIAPGDRDYVPPRPVRQPGPVYPIEMSAQGLEGRVTVEFVIDQNGNVREPRLVRSTDQEFEAPALEAILQWKFTPGQVRGRKVAVRASQIVEFNLEEETKVPPDLKLSEPIDLSLRGQTKAVPPRKP